MTARRETSARHRQALGAALALAGMVVMSPAQLTSAAARGCGVDAATGVPAAESPGLCVIQSGSQTVFVQVTQDGLLVAATDSSADDLGSPNADGTAPLNIYDRDAVVVFCPPELLDPDSGAPTRECLLSLDAMTAGAAALVGRGRVFVSAVVDASGSAQCPTSITVMASTTSPGGDDLEVNSSFTLSPVGRRGGAGAPSARRCAVSQQELRVSYLNSGDGARTPTGTADVNYMNEERTRESLATELTWIRELTPEEWRIVAELVRLDDQEWVVVQRLLSLGTDQVDELVALLQADGAAVLTDAGGVAAVEASSPAGAGTTVTTEAVEGILDDILARVNSILSTVTSVAARIPNREDVRSLLPNADDVARIAAMLQNVREMIGGALAVAATMRDGFEEWYGADCSPSSECGEFKADLRALISDLGDTSEFIQLLSCLEQPGMPIRRPDLSLMQTLVVDDAPAVVLFSLAKVFQSLDPPTAGSGGWPRLFRDVLDEVPAGFQATLTELCERPGDSPEIGGSSGLVCTVLRPEEVGLALAAARSVAYRKAQTAEFIDSFFKDDIVAQAGAVAGGGAGAGTNVKSPPKVVSERAKNLAEDLPDKVGNIIELRNQCLEADADIEDQLRDCQPPISVLLQTTDQALPPHPTFSDVQSVVQMRLDQVRLCQGLGLCQGLRVADAANFLAAANGGAGTVAGYRNLCCAYQALNGGSQIPCPRP